MATIVTFAKENFQLIILLVSLLGVVVAILSLVSEMRKRKRGKQERRNEK